MMLLKLQLLLQLLHVEPNIDLVFKTSVKQCVEFVSQVDLISNKVVKPSSTLDIFVDDDVNEPLVSETSTETK